MKLKPLSIHFNWKPYEKMKQKTEKPSDEETHSKQASDGQFCSQGLFFIEQHLYEALSILTKMGELSSRTKHF